MPVIVTGITLSSSNADAADSASKVRRDKDCERAGARERGALFETAPHAARWERRATWPPRAQRRPKAAPAAPAYRARLGDSAALGRRPAPLGPRRLCASRPARRALPSRVYRSHPTGYAAVDAICDYYNTLQSRTVKPDVQPGYLIKALPTSAPTTGQPFAEIAADFQKHIVPGLTHWQHGKFFAYFPACTTFESMLGDLYSSSVTNPGFNWTCSPACTELEQVVLDWMVDVLGLDKIFLTSSGRGGGIISGSASESALTAAIGARERALRVLTQQASNGALSLSDAIDVPDKRREENTAKLVMYGSTQTHSLGAKAAKILGLTFRALPVRAADNYALRGATLAAAVEEDIANGLIPFFAIGTVGTTSTGAVDYIAEIGQVVRAHPTMFLHIDSAWAGVAYALPETREELRLAEVNEYADSFCTNMHKWGLVGFDCSLFYVRERRDLTEALDVTPAFLRTKEGDEGSVIDYRNWQLALGRRFRSIKLWFVLRSYGVEGLQKHLRTGIEYCDELAKLVKASSNFEIVAPPSLSLLDFRLVPANAAHSEAELNALNRDLHARLVMHPDVHLTQTLLKSEESEVFCIRFAIGQNRTTLADVQEVWAIVEAEATRLLLKRKVLNGVTNGVEVDAAEVVVV
ncbi:hypothetical protein VHUM_02817 [Vanrija humicola]|uniref:Aromatic-L-amino-acid decarboxylase n=1 Tax=Vanrija humicola TaxID=5417 RepID=A0A7D8V0N3_VANHU|nr:hypothetical protein VHUM_02817 [Vanrija humicola]